MRDQRWNSVLCSSMIIMLDDPNIPKDHLLLAFSQPLLEHHQSLVPVGDPVLATRCQYKDRVIYMCVCVCETIRKDQRISYLGLFVHLGICFAFVLKNRIPSCKVMYQNLNPSYITLCTYQSWSDHGVEQSYPAHSIRFNLCRWSSKSQPTLVRPWNRMGSEPGPRQKAKVHTASAVRSSKPSSILFSPS